MKKHKAKKSKLKKQAEPEPRRKPKTRPLHFFGSMKGEIKILGDIISPANDEDEWEVLRD